MRTNDLTRDFDPAHGPVLWRRFHRCERLSPFRFCSRPNRRSVCAGTKHDACSDPNSVGGAVEDRSFAEPTLQIDGAAAR